MVATDPVVICGFGGQVVVGGHRRGRGFRGVRWRGPWRAPGYTLYADPWDPFAWMAPHPSYPYEAAAKRRRDRETKARLKRVERKLDALLAQRGASQQYR